MERKRKMISFGRAGSGLLAMQIFVVSSSGLVQKEFWVWFRN